MSGFGLRPLRVFAVALLTILAFGVYYHQVDGVQPVRPRESVGLVECLYFSCITFATVGYGDFVPRPHCRLAAMVEGISGVFTMGFFVVVLSYRLKR